MEPEMEPEMLIDVAKATLTKLANAKNLNLIEFLKFLRICSLHFEPDECSDRPETEELHEGFVTTVPIFPDDDFYFGTYKECVILVCPSDSDLDRKYVVCYLGTFDEIVYKIFEEQYIIYMPLDWY